MNLFISTVNQTTFLFAFILIGYLLSKFGKIPENSATVLSNLENTIFIPALVMGTFMNNFTLDKVSAMWKLLSTSCLILFVVVPIALFISKCLSKDKYIQRIYTYGLTFSNFGFMGNAVISALFPEIFFEYLIFTLPLWTLIYLWGVPRLLIADSGKKQTLRKTLRQFVNPMFIGMIIGMIIGIAKIPLPVWFRSLVDVSADCMSPIAMILTGVTVSRISLRKTFTDLGIYAVTMVRLIVIPLAFIGVAHFIPMKENIYICALSSLAMPLGLNTIVIPSAYGKDTSVAAGMAVVSHFLSCITIPLVFLLA